MEIKKIIAERILTEEEAEKLCGKFLKKEQIKIFIDYDCDVFDVCGNLLVRFRKNIVDKEILKKGWDNYSGSIRLTEGRGTAAGEYYFRKRLDGKPSNFKVTPKVESGNVGFMDRSGASDYCRMTEFAASNPINFKTGFEFVEHIDELYKELCPDYYKLQKAVADATNRNYVIGDTCFTTVTVNRNFQTAVHKDAGDFPKGFGNIIVIEDGNYEGCLTCMPEFGLGVDVRTGDIMFCDVHKWHGNTPFEPKQEKYLRGTFVLYYREFMLQCKQPSEELKKLKMDKGGFMKL